MPALSPLVADNGEHTGTGGSRRCPAVVFTIVGPGSLQTGAGSPRPPAWRMRAAPPPVRLARDPAPAVRPTAMAAPARAWHVLRRRA
ncbi:unnamed protein product [Miscanthus lutarioriparius]|uniref:Uncharacterized protein n=1 Tax=Miscanthus lutarioriparius TaxID=422564 RepID=A0A811SHE9_9POAL|nr:unnamed protein product [Miscanthus lutarioriparius]